MEEALKDERFSHIFTDPRFRKMPKHIQKVSVDKRFKGMFKDKKFKEKCQLDKRGRPVNLSPAENLKKLYAITSESSEDEDENEVRINKKKEINKLKKMVNNKETELSEHECEKKMKGENVSSEITNVKESDDSAEDSSEEESDEISIKKDSEESDDSDDSESDDDDDGSHENKNEDFDHRWEELRNDAPDTDEITHRIAVCNMDWDRIRAEDLFVCFNSFKPPDGCISSVKIYPSEYGLKRMEEEKICGPPELVEETLPLDAEESKDPKGSKYHREKLRQYQINRLKYYYAVVDCDSPETANILYEKLNGMEYESSSIRFDLRFIPDDMTFDQEPISAADKLPDPSEYKPRLFLNSALQQVKVNLTWDETDPKRREFLEKVFIDPDSVVDDLHNYLASASSDSEDDAEMKEGTDEKSAKLSTSESIARYRKLLEAIEEEERKRKQEKEKYEIEITWDTGLKEKTEKMVKEKMNNESLTPFEEMLQKRKEKRKQKKAVQKQMENDSLCQGSDDELILSNSSASNGKMSVDHKKLAELALMSDSMKEVDFNEKLKKKNKEKMQKGNNFKCNVNDPRFSAIYSSPLFNIDPSDPHFKNSEGNVALIQEKQKRLESSKYHERYKNPKKARHH